MNKLVVLISGNGSNLQEIINCSENKTIDCNIVGVICNKKKAFGLERATKHNLNSYYLPFLSKNREEYDQSLCKVLDELKPDLVVLAGWMHVLGEHYVNSYGDKTINLHPAYPHEFVGKDCIKQAFESNKKQTGVMVHKVVKEVDKGEVICKKRVPINKTDTLETLTNRVKYYEKPLLIEAIQTFLKTKKSDHLTPSYKGKVRDIYDIGYNKLLMKASSRLSSFDRFICEVPDKGVVLNKLSEWWFKQTKHIVPNHMLHCKEDMMVVKKCRVIPLEIVVRGYITGSTKTSLWTHYNNGERVYCGITFPDGLVKNQQLDNPVVTPTTKGVVDVPISGEEIVKQKIVDLKTWNYLYDTALKLFKFGQMVASYNGFLLVDTKYEFGLDENNNILLIDELHTCDSSRFWDKDSYLERFNNNKEPKKLDKDVVRNWVKQRCDPYNDKLPEIPEDLINKVREVYVGFYNKLTDIALVNNKLTVSKYISEYYDKYINNFVIIVAGSESDREYINKLKDKGNKLNVYCKDYICSAHKNTKKLVGLIDEWNSLNKNIVFIAVAGRSNALGAVLASNLKYSVISCPPFKDKSDFTVNINSSLQNPSNVPALTVLDAGNAILASKKMLIN